MGRDSERGSVRSRTARVRGLIGTAPASVVAMVTTTLSAWVAVPFALRRFRKERRWERRAEAYERVLTGLAHLKAYLDVKWDEEMMDKKVSAEAERDLQRRAAEARKEVSLAVDLGGFLLSGEARKRLRTFQKEDGEASNESSWFEYLDSRLAATASCLDELTEIAACDLE